MKLSPAVDTMLDEEEIFVRTIDFHDLRTALIQGWEDFLYNRGDLVFVGFIYPVAILLAVLLVSHASVLPLIFPLVAGSVLFGPAVASGFYELARRREMMLDTRWRHFFDVLRGPAAFQIIGLTVVIFFLFTLWISVAWGIYSATVGASEAIPAGSVSGFFDAVLNTSEGWRMIVVGNVVGLGFAFVVLAISVVSFPMLVDQPVGIGVAMHTSVRVARKNPVTVAVWGFIVVALLVLGSLPALVGLAIVFPVLGYATWHLYTRAVVR
ncbi:MAG TPA: DUF2189 domain-containing protein [Novosphingobium sp.]|nr:DUF2189 domain-containing protein [Novosphingobium sp.]